MSEQKRIFLAVALSGLVLFGWQAYFMPKQDEATKSAPATQTQELKERMGESEVIAPETLESKSAAAPIEPAVTATETLTLAKEGNVYNFQNDLSVQNIVDPKAVFDFQAITDKANPFQIKVLIDDVPRNLNFAISEKSETSLKGRDESLGIDLHAQILENGRFDLKLLSDNAYTYRFVFRSTAKELENHQVSQFVFYSKDIERQNVGSESSGDGSAKWFGLDFNFHLFAFIFKDKIPARYHTDKAGRFIVDTVDPIKEFSGDLVFTKKNYDELVAIGDNLNLSVDFGFFGVLAVPILRGLQMFYDWIPNYGIAVILLTLVVRTILFPLQFKSFKSMKKMQKLQPELAKLKEKFSDDPQRMQRETMELFKKAGANPLGGCLPLLLQMPIFFAFYKVLYNAVELVGAPFYGWITDLSVKDPYYVLPVLMGLAMLGQQKLTPSTSMDPTQKKIMMIMPIVFTFIMKDLPAGLNLYIFVSTLFGIIQQLLVYRMID